jgi:hypothetical protein
MTDLSAAGREFDSLQARQYISRESIIYALPFFKASLAEAAVRIPFASRPAGSPKTYLSRIFGISLAPHFHHLAFLCVILVIFVF